ncbi:MAG: Vitamin B12 dependent methionine synthase activation subunit [Clostridia bacterium]|nr:Vitamin B12 dependent methionine synthase activation subunit [Clostridia bacterium]
MNYDVVYSHSQNAADLHIDQKEILRYMGHKGAACPQTQMLIGSLMENVRQNAMPRGAFVLKKLEREHENIKIGSMDIKSKNLARNLEGCEDVIVFAITCGAQIDRLIDSKSSTEPSKALAISAIATTLCEAYADSLCGELKAYFANKGLYLRPRFSPGYGDFLLEFQKDIVSLTDAAKRCSINLTDSLMLVPSKSVTGIIGIGKEMTHCPPLGCEACDKTDCRYRR